MPSSNEAINDPEMLPEANRTAALMQSHTVYGSSSELLLTIVRQAAQLLKSTGGCFFLVNQVQQTVTCAVSYGLDVDYTGVCLRFGEGVAGRVAQIGEALIIEDYRTWSGRADGYENNHPFRSVMSAPVTWEGQLTGVLSVFQSNDSHPFTAIDLELLTVFAHQVAIAIENARLYLQATTEHQHLRLLYDLGREVSTSQNPDEILRRSANLTCKAMGGLLSGAYLYHPADGRLSLRALTGYQERVIRILDTRAQMRVGKGLAGWVAEHREPVGIGDLLQDQRWLAIRQIDENARSAICSPIQFDKELLGVLIVTHSQVDYFNGGHLSLLEAICQTVAVALSNANRYAETQRRLTEITVIQKLAQTFNQQREVQVLLDEVVRQIVGQLGYPQASIYLVEEDRLKIKAGYGQISKNYRSELSAAVVNSVARTGQTVYLPNVSMKVAENGEIDEAFTEIDVPIYLGKSVVGVISILDEANKELSDRALDILPVMAGQVSAALENAVLYDQLRKQTRDLESTVGQRTAELTELYALSQEIGFVYSFPDLLQRLLRHLRRAIQCDLVAVCLHLDERNFFIIETRRPLQPAIYTTFRRMCQETGGPALTAAMDESPERVEAEDYDPNLPAMEQVGSFLHTPIVVGQRSVGMIFAADEYECLQRVEHSRLLTTFANQASSAVTRLSNIISVQQQQLSSLVEQLPVGLLLLDANFHLLLANPTGREHIQMINGTDGSGSALAQLGPYDLAELTTRDNLSAPVEIAVDGASRRIFSIQIRPVKPITATEGDAWVLLVSDLTQEKENQARIESQNRLATVGQLAAGIAHDFNNIMATILVYSDLLRFDPAISESSHEKLSVIQAQIQRAASLIRQILDFSRKSVIEHINLDLLPMLKELDKMLMRVLPETIRVELAYQPGAYWVSGDPTRLQQALMNLALNSRDAMPQGGVLRFEIEIIRQIPAHLSPIHHQPPENWIRISVSDTGSGIAVEIMDHLFEPFYTTKPAGQGTGLGLAQVYGIITQHGGVVDVDTHIGQGTSVHLYLPAIKMQKKVTGQLIQPSIFDGGGRTVLVVEDDATTREALYTVLEAANFKVLAAANGVKALAVMRSAQTRIDLIVSDVVMPELGGIGLYKTVTEANPQARVLLITGHPLDEVSQELLERGEVRWLQKPFSISDFSRALAASFNAA